MKKNPLNDDHYTGNDEQIDDLKELVEELKTVLEGVFVTGPDEDGILMVRFEPKTTTGKGALAIKSSLIAGQVINIWREDRNKLLAKMEN